MRTPVIGCGKQSSRASGFRGQIHRRTCVALFALSSALTPWLMADGFRNPPDGPQAIGRIGGHIAQSDDVTAVVHNPANLPDAVRSPVGQVNVTAGYGRSRFTSQLTGASEESQEPYSFLPSVYAATPLAGDKCVFGMAVSLPFGRSTTWSDTGVFRYTAPHYTALTTVEGTPVIATRLTPTLSAAVGIGYAWSSVEYHQYLPYSVSSGGALPDAEMRLDGSGDGWRANVAIAWTPAEGQKMALTYKSAMKVRYEGDRRVDYTPPIPGAPDNRDVRTSITYPEVASAAYGVSIGKDFRLEAQMEWVAFSVYDELRIETGADSQTMPQDWKDTWTFGIGGDWSMTPEWTLRGGVMHLQSPAPDRTFTPSMADQDQYVVSVGAGFRSGRHAFDIAYALGIIDDRNVRDSATVVATPSGNVQPYNGNYEFDAHLLSVGYRVSF